MSEKQGGVLFVYPIAELFFNSFCLLLLSIPPPLFFSVSLYEGPRAVFDGCDRGRSIGCSRLVLLVCERGGKEAIQEAAVS